MKTRWLILALVMCTGRAYGWEVFGNPDKYPSIGFDVSTGKLAEKITGHPTSGPAFWGLRKSNKGGK